MKKYALVSDSCSYFSQEDIEKMNIHQASLNILDGDESVKELDVDVAYVRNKLDNQGRRLSTSQPSPGEFLSIYEQCLEEGYEKVFVVTLSEPISGTYQSAKLAKNMLDDPSVVHLFKSKAAAFGNEMYFFIMDQMMEEGATFEEIVETIEELISNTEVVITVENLMSLFRSGRLSKAKAAIGTVMRVKPVIKMVEGKLEMYKSFRSNKKVIEEMVHVLNETSFGYKKLYVRVQSHNSDETALNLKNAVEDAYPDAVVTYNDYLGPVFNIHIGKKGYGIGWCYLK